jgi:hypothetical protein
MKTLVFLIRVLVALTLAAVLFVAVLFLAVEATVAWYLQYYAIASRLELSEDYGFGMLVFFVQCATAVVALPLAMFAGWRLSARIQVRGYAAPKTSSQKAS